ncbi:MAG: hypothetical protein H0T45_05890 [Pyrinomonadaceae bacterium]|nr:hypothetical protein [Pyrinomonadaceae bacterium]
MSTLRGEKGASSPPPRRSRIVVNVDDLPPRQGSRGGRISSRPPGASRGVRRVVLFIAAVTAALFVFALVGFYFWWQSNKSTPAYALTLAVDAAERDDRQAFDALVDIDSVTRGMVPQVIEKVTGRGSTLNLPAPARRFIAANAAVLLPGTRDALRDAIMQEIKAASVKSGAAQYPFLIKAIALPRLIETTMHGAERDAGATLVFKVGDNPIELQMQRAVGQSAAPNWKIVSVKSDELAARIAGGLARNLPSSSR